MRSSSCCRLPARGTMPRIVSPWCHPRPSLPLAALGAPLTRMSLASPSGSGPTTQSVHALLPSLRVPLVASSPWATRRHLSHSRRLLALLVESSPTPNNDCLRFFSMDLSFLPQGQTMDMPNFGHAYKSPLAAALFAIDGVVAVFFADEYVTVTKDAVRSWDDLSLLVKEAITAFAESKQPLLSTEGEQEIGKIGDDTEPAVGDDEVVLAVKELIASRIRPIMQGDGGNVRYVGFDNGLVYVRLEGACKACPSSGQTLKFAIERMLMHWIPEVEEVQECDEEFELQFKAAQAQAASEASAHHGAAHRAAAAALPTQKHPLAAQPTA